jgi:DNA primase
MGDRDGGVKEGVRAATDIVDVISPLVTLKRVGKTIKGLCPFHQEKTPSFTVNTERQTFKCFGCGEGGDVFSFVEKYERVDFKEALRMLAERAGIPLVFSEESRRRAEERERGYGALEKACLFFQSKLPGSPAEDYLKERGFSPGTIEQFRVGYIPDEWGELTDHFGTEPRKRIACEAGLLKERQSGGYYDFFRNRLMFPISDWRGRVVGFGARTLLSDEERKRMKEEKGIHIPKYINTGETPFFIKGQLLYGLRFAIEEIRKLGVVGVVEGYTDVMRSHEHGVKNILAAIGTSFTSDHLSVLDRKFPDSKIVLCLDGDVPGKNAAAKKVEELAGRKLWVCLLPEDHDPDSFLRAGGDFASKIANPQSAFNFFVGHKAEGLDLNTAEGRMDLIDRSRKFLDAVPHDRRRICMETLADQAGLSRRAVIDYIIGPGDEESPPDIGFGNAQDQRVYEAEFIRQLVHAGSPETRRYFCDVVHPGDFSRPETRLTFQHLAGEREQLLLGDQMSLLEGKTPEVLITEINARAEKAEVVLNQTLLGSLFKRPSTKDRSLRAMEHTYMMMLCSSLPYEIGTAYWRGEKSLSDLASTVRKAREEVHDG